MRVFKSKIVLKFSFESITFSQLNIFKRNGSGFIQIITDPDLGGSKKYGFEFGILILTVKKVRVCDRFISILVQLQLDRERFLKIFWFVLVCFIKVLSVSVVSILVRNTETNLNKPKKIGGGGVWETNRKTTKTN